MLTAYRLQSKSEDYIKLMGAAFLKADPAFNDTSTLTIVCIYFTFSDMFYVVYGMWIQFWLFAYEIYLINHGYACTHTYANMYRVHLEIKTYGIHLPLNCISKSKLNS